MSFRDTDRVDFVTSEQHLAPVVILKYANLLMAL